MQLSPSHACIQDVIIHLSFCLCAGHKSSGSVKLELQFSAHSNPSLLTVKLIDLVLMSSKAMSLGKRFCNDDKLILYSQCVLTPCYMHNAFCMVRICWMLLSNQIFDLNNEWWRW